MNLSTVNQSRSGLNSSFIGARFLQSRDVLLVSMLLILCFYLYSHWIWRPTSPDERGYLAWGMKIFKEGRYETLWGTPVVKVPPLHSHLVAAGFHLFGPTVDAAQAMSLIFGCLCVGLAYCFGRSFWGWRVGLIAALILLTAAKGEFWRYSNRVLNDIHLTFFVFLTLFGLCLYWRYGRWWMGGLAGVGLGLGLLTKEFAILILPLFVPVFLLREGKWTSKWFSLATALLLAALIVLPWIWHVKEVSGSPLGGVRQRAEGYGMEILFNARAWGFIPAGKFWNMVRFYDKPAWITQVFILFSILYGGWRFGFTRHRSGEGIIVIGAVLIWFGVFAIFKALEVNLRRLIPLLPIISLLVAILFDDIWKKRGDFASWIWDRRCWCRYGLLILFAVFLLNNLKPHRVLREFDPLCVLCSNRAPYLMNEVHRALDCVPPGVLVLTNYKSLVYFYSQGKRAALPLAITTAKESSPWVEEKKRRELEKGSTNVIYDFVHKSKRIIMDEGAFLEHVKNSGARYILFFQTKPRIWSPVELVVYLRSQPGHFLVVCEGRGYGVYQVKGL